MFELMSCSPIASLTPEVRLLLACARTSIDINEAAHIRVLAEQTSDWQYLLHSALRHRILPLLYRNLHSSCMDLVPQAVMDQLRFQFHESARHNLHLTGELFVLCELFASENIPIVPIKGPAISFSAYSDLALRQFSDLDILIQREDFGRARRLLMTRGYHPEAQRVDIDETAYLRQYHDYKLWRDDGLMLELQWGIIQNPFVFPTDIHRLWKHRITISLNGKQMPSLSPEDTLLMLCVHGSKHLWERLIWVCDVAEFIRSCPNLNWHLVATRARNEGVERMLALGLLQANTILGTQIPEPIRHLVERDTHANTLAAQMYNGMFGAPDAPSRLDTELPALLYLRMMNRTRDKLRLIINCASSLSNPIRLYHTYGLAPIKHLLGI